MTRYVPANSFATPRFSGVRTFMRLPNVQDLQYSDVAIVGEAAVRVIDAETDFARG